MNKFFLVAVIICLIATSCDSIVFEKTQPVGTPYLKKFPAGLQGSWAQEKDDRTDHLYIENDSFSLESSDKRRNIKGHLDTLQHALKKFRNYWVINERNDSGYYYVRFIELAEDHLKIYKLQSGNMDQLSKITAATLLFDDPDKGKFYSINPDKQALGKITKGHLLLQTDEFERE